MNTKRCYVCGEMKPTEEICLNKKCKSCMREYKKLWYKTNKVEIREKQEVYRTVNKEHLRSADKLWRKNNKEKDRVRTAKWAKNNSEKRSEAEQRRRARKHGSQVVKITPEMLKARMEIFGGRCAYCGGPFEHWDHLKPLELQGPHILSNLRPSCAKCNIGKGAMHPRDWFRTFRITSYVRKTM